MKNPILKTSRGIHESLSNLWYKRECSIAKIEDAVADSKCGADLVRNLNKLNLLRKFTLDRETDEKVRLKAVDGFGNVSYFEATKEPKDNSSWWKDHEGMVLSAIRELSNIREQYSIFDEEDCEKHWACTTAIKALKELIN